MPSTHNSKLITPNRTGQVMILTVLALGGVLLTATAIGGLLTVLQIRQAADFSNSTKAIFAADTGLEWGLYQFFQPASTAPQPSLTNGATFTVECFDDLNNQLPDCTDFNTKYIRSFGSAAGVSRAFELSL